MKKQGIIITAILSAVALVITVLMIGFFSFLKTQELKTQVKLEEEKTKQEILKKEAENKTEDATSVKAQAAAPAQPAANTASQQQEKMPKAESEERLIVRKPVDVRKGSYCISPVPGKSYFNTATVYDPNPDNPYMADIHFKDCVIYGTHSQGEYKGRHTGPITMTVSLAGEKNFRAVMNRNKWYLENGEIKRIDGLDYGNVYFNGWLMYKQTQ